MDAKKKNPYSFNLWVSLRREIALEPGLKQARAFLDKEELEEVVARSSTSLLPTGADLLHKSYCKLVKQPRLVALSPAL